MELLQDDIATEAGRPANDKDDRGGKCKVGPLSPHLAFLSLGIHLNGGK